MKLPRIVVYAALAVVAYYVLRGLNASLSLDFSLARAEPSPFDLVLDSRTTAAAQTLHSSLPSVTTILLIVAGLGATTLLLHFGRHFLKEARLTTRERRRTQGNNRQPAARQQGRGVERSRNVPRANRRVPQLTDGRSRAQRETDERERVARARAAPPDDRRREGQA